ncbi:MAG: hypothetical protein ACERLM_15730, partial [Acidimicrobiales bacterium]
VRLVEVIASSTRADRAIADVVSTALEVIDDSPVLARLTSTDLRESLPFITVDSRRLVDGAVSTVSDAIRAAPDLAVDERAVDEAVEEATRFVLSQLTTPRRDGSRLSPRDAGARAAALIAPMLEPVET